MPRKKKERVIWQQRFNLSSDNPDDVRLHDYLMMLAENGDAAKWMRDTLRNAVPSEYNNSTSVVPRNDDKPKTVAATPVPPDYYGKSIIEDLNPMLEKVAKEQAKIEQKTITTTAKPVGNMTPAERLAANRAAARVKLDKPKPLNGK